MARAMMMRPVIGGAVAPEAVRSIATRKEAAQRTLGQAAAKKAAGKKGGMDWGSLMTKVLIGAAIGAMFPPAAAGAAGAGAGAGGLVMPASGIGYPITPEQAQFAARQGF